MNIRKANIFITRESTLGFVPQEPVGVELGYLDAAFNVLRKFDRIIFPYPETTELQNYWRQLLTARFREFPNAKFYGYTSKLKTDIFAIWATQENLWNTLYGGLINGIYIADFDAIDEDIDTQGLSQGTFTRTDQNLAVTGCHNDGYEVFAESMFPNLTLGGAAIGEADPLIGRSLTLQDGIIIKNYTSDVKLTGDGFLNEQRSRDAREGAARFIKTMSDRGEINLYTALSHHSPHIDIDTSSEATYVPLDKWLTISRETEEFGIDGFGVNPTQEYPTVDNRWFSTNKSNSDVWEPRSKDSNLILSYAKLYGFVEPTEPENGIPTFTLKYKRTVDLVNNYPYLEKSGEVEITPDYRGYWEIILAASPDTGTVYTILIDNDSCKTIRKNVTLIGGTSVAY